MAGEQDGEAIDLSPLPVTYSSEVSPQHLDRFDHVNVMWYTHFFDEATLGLFERLGCGPSYYGRSGCGMFALEQHVRYLGELRAREAFQIRARMLGVSSRRIHFLLFLALAGRSEPSATSELVGVHVDLARRRSVPLPEAVRLEAEALLRQHQRLPWVPAVCGVMAAERRR